MSTGITSPEERELSGPTKKPSGFSKGRISGKPAEGEITRQIGSGENAKNSIIWLTIRWSFIVAAITTLAIYLRPTYCQADIGQDLVGDIKAIWSVFMPVITLALGYAFGKSR